MGNKVAVVCCNNYDKQKVQFAINRCLKLINFKFDHIHSVLIKPNLAWPATPDQAVTTHPAVILALCKMLKAKGIRVVIGESSIYGTRQAFVTSGISEVASSMGIKTVSFSSCPLITVKGIPVPKILYEVDLVINMPKLKTHSLTKYTGAVKNILGIVPGAVKGRLHQKYPGAMNFSSFLVNLYQSVSPGLTIMDAVVSMEGDGPTTGIPVKTGMILASRDGIALDDYACKITKLDNVPTNYIASKKGLLRKYTPVGDHPKVTALRKPSAFLAKIVGLSPRRLTQTIGKVTIKINPHKCHKCGLCQNHCPVKAINNFKIDSVRCISCYCCNEICPYRAVQIKLSTFFIALRNAKKLVSFVKKSRIPGSGY